MVRKLHDRAEQREVTGGTVTWRAIATVFPLSDFVAFTKYMKQDVCSDELANCDGHYTLDKLVAYLDRELIRYPDFHFGADTLKQRAWSPLMAVAPPTPRPSLDEFHTEMQQFRRSVLERVDGLARNQCALTNNSTHAFDAFKAEVLREQDEGFNWLRDMVAAHLTHVPQLDTKHTPVDGVVDYDLEPRLRFTQEVDEHRQPVYKHVLGGTAQSPRFKCYHVLLMKVTALKHSKSAIKHASNNCAPKKHGPDPATVAQRLGLMEEQVKEDLQQLRIDIKLQRVTVDTTLPA